MEEIIEGKLIHKRYTNLFRGNISIYTTLVRPGICILVECNSDSACFCLMFAQRRNESIPLHTHNLYDVRKLLSLEVDAIPF